MRKVALFSSAGERARGDTLEIKQYSRLRLEFPVNIQSLDSFIMHLPPLVVGDGYKVPDMDAVKFNRVKVWRAVTIN